MQVMLRDVDDDGTMEIIVEGIWGASAGSELRMYRYRGGDLVPLMPGGSVLSHGWEFKDLNSDELDEIVLQHRYFQTDDVLEFDGEKYCWANFRFPAFHRSHEKCSSYQKLIPEMLREKGYIAHDWLKVLCLSFIYQARPNLAREYCEDLLRLMTSTEVMMQEDRDLEFVKELIVSIQELCEQFEADVGEYYAHSLESFAGTYGASSLSVHDWWFPKVTLSKADL
jgi:hypothetical protein